MKLKARVTSLVARSAASRMLGYTCELENEHCHRTFSSTHANYNNSYSLLFPLSTPPGGRPSLCVLASLMVFSMRIHKRLHICICFYHFPFLRPSPFQTMHRAAEALPWTLPDLQGLRPQAAPRTLVGLLVCWFNLVGWLVGGLPSPVVGCVCRLSVSLLTLVAGIASIRHRYRHW